MTTAAVTASASDATLIAAVRVGDPAAYGFLYERHSAAARSAARKLVRTAADTDDVVAETFARVLSAIRTGAGPVDAFRPYLVTSVRHVAFDHLRGQRSQVPTDETDLPDPGGPLVDIAVESLERSLVARAFRSLPERWSAVLWHTEVEQAKPAEVATLLGLTPNGVAALSYRAREGLRQAYLQLHLSARAKRSASRAPEARRPRARADVAGATHELVDAHLSGCADADARPVVTINEGARTLAPVFLGGALAGAGAHGAGARRGGGAGAHRRGRAARGRARAQAHGAGAAAAAHGAGAGAARGSAHGAGAGAAVASPPTAGGGAGARAPRGPVPEGTWARLAGWALRHRPVVQIAVGLAATAADPGSTVPSP
jgi:RNA polymerase sigma factor (sigma-70 family)